MHRPNFSGFDAPTFRHLRVKRSDRKTNRPDRCVRGIFLEPVRILALCLVPVASCFLAFPEPAGALKKKNNYDYCAAALLRVEVPPENAATACATVLRPEELGRCVVDIAQKTDIMPLDALSTCRGVRRPLELATCVVDISAISDAVDNPAILDFCSRSLLPERFSQCVVGLHKEIDLIAIQALGICIEAGDRIRDLDPTFIPGDGRPVQPAPPSKIPST